MNEINKKDIDSKRLPVPKKDNSLGTFTQYSWAGPELSEKEKECLNNLKSISNIKLGISILLFALLICLIIYIVKIISNYV